MEITGELALQLPTMLGEGAFWDAACGLLYWVDIEAGVLYRFDPQRATNEAHELGNKVGTVVPTRSGQLLVALQNSIARYDPNARTLRELVPFEVELPANRANDGKCDPAGRFWVGSIAPEARGAALYRLDTDLALTKMVAGVHISNGIVWSADRGTMYYIDTPTREVCAYDYDHHSGAIANRRVVIRVPHSAGFPDGMTIDAEGMLWIAHFGGWGVRRWDPHTGEQLAYLRLPVKNVTSCAFGGDDLSTLYVTTARFLATPQEIAQQPLAGSLFCAQPGVRGVEGYAFDDSTL